MAILKIAEFTDKGMHPPSLAKVPALAQQVITFSTATASSPFNAAANMVRLISDTICAIEFSDTAGAAATAATTAATAIKLNAQVPEYFYVKPGSALNVIADT